MSRKRLLKKEQQRAAALGQQLEDLYRRGADDAFLELADSRGRELAEVPAERYREVADRALASALAAGNLGRAGRLVRWLRRDAALRPLGRLAAVVDHLAEGRLEEARSGLAALEEAGEAPRPFPPRLPAALAPLCVPEFPAGAGTPISRALESFYRELCRLEGRRYQAGGREIRALLKLLASVRRELPGDPPDPAARKVLDAADERLRLLAALDETESAVRGAAGTPARRPTPERLFVERTRGLWPRLEKVFRGGAPAALLRPLQHALRLRWRSLLELLAEPDHEIWALLSTESPELSALDLDGVGADRSAEWRRVRQLLACREYGELARLLAAKSRSETAPDRLVVLWSLELWAWKQEARGEGEQELREEGGTEPAEAALSRLRRMADEIARRVPAGQRAEAARFLRTELVKLVAAVPFCRDSLDAAGSLLQHLPDDPVLLAVAVASAASAGDARARDLFAARIVQRGASRVPVRTDDLPSLLAVVAALDAPEPLALARTVALLRPLLGAGGWPEALVLASRALLAIVKGCLAGGWSRSELQRLRSDVTACRSLLPEAAGLDALEAVLACLRAEGRMVGELRQFLARSPTLDDALVAFQVLDVAAGPWGSPEIRQAAGEARAAVVGRLDTRWRLWRPLLPALVVGPDSEEIRQLKTRLRRLLKTKGLPPQDRTALADVLDEVAELEQMKREFERQIMKSGRRLFQMDDDQLDFEF